MTAVISVISHTYCRRNRNFRIYPVQMMRQSRCKPVFPGCIRKTDRCPPMKKTFLLKGHNPVYLFPLRTLKQIYLSACTLFQKFRKINKISKSIIPIRKAFRACAVRSIPIDKCLHGIHNPVYNPSQQHRFFDQIQRCGSHRPGTHRRPVGSTVFPVSSVRIRTQIRKQNPFKDKGACPVA